LQVIEVQKATQGQQSLVQPSTENVHSMSSALVGPLQHQGLFMQGSSQVFAPFQHQGGLLQQGLNQVKHEIFILDHWFYCV
jgi:hypothetical protein